MKQRRTKKKILAPLLSAAVIPGLGQAVNGSLKKAATLLILVTLVASGGVVSLYLSLGRAAKEGELFSDLGSTLAAADLTIPALFLAAFALIWIFSLVDAFLEGRKLDARDEILLDR